MRFLEIHIDVTDPELQATLVFTAQVDIPEDKYLYNYKEFMEKFIKPLEEKYKSYFPGCHVCVTENDIDFDN